MDIPSKLAHSLISLIDGGSIVAVVVGVAKAFEWFDGMVSDTGRQALTNQLKNAPPDEQIDSWAAVFPRLIDRVFGKRALSLRFILRSCIASFIAMLIVELLFYRVNVSRSAGHKFVSKFTTYPVLMNFTTDYFSLLISRAIVRLMARRQTPFYISLLLLIDTAFTALLSIMSQLFITYSLFYGLYHYQPVGRMVALSGLVNFHAPISVFFYSAFFPTLWVWLYVVSIVAIKLLHHASAIWVKITPYLDIEKKPLVAIGKVAGLLAGTGYAVILGFIWIGHHWH